MRTLLALALAAGVATQALAHPVLESSSPAAGAVLTESPPELRLSFSEKIEPRFSRIELVRGSDQIKTAPAHADPATPGVLVVALPALPPGRYQVRWRAVSADSHRLEGDLGFEVRP